MSCLRIKVIDIQLTQFKGGMIFITKSCNAEARTPLSYTQYRNSSYYYYLLCQWIRTGTKKLDGE